MFLWEKSRSACSFLSGFVPILEQSGGYRELTGIMTCGNVFSRSAPQICLAVHPVVELLLRLGRTQKRAPTLKKYSLVIEPSGKQILYLYTKNYFSLFFPWINHFMYIPQIPLLCENRCRHAPWVHVASEYLEKINVIKAISENWQKSWYMTCWHYPQTN